MTTEKDADKSQSESVDAAIAKLYAEHGKPLKRRLSRTCKQQDALDDMIQEAFLRLRQALSRSTGRPVRDPIGLLYTIAGHVLIDQIRRERNSSRHEESLEVRGSEIPDSALGLEEWMCRREAIELRRQIILQLPDRQRTAVQLKIAGLTPAQIAREMDIDNVTAVYRLLQQAHKRCQRKLRALKLDDHDEY